MKNLCTKRVNVGDDLFFCNQGGILDPEDFKRCCLNCPPMSIVLLIQNQVGYENLKFLEEQSTTKYFFNNTPYIPFSLLLQHREGLLIGYSGRDFCLPEIERVDDFLHFVRNIDFLEIIKRQDEREKYDGCLWDDKSAQSFMEHQLVLAKILGIPVVEFIGA